MPTKPTPSAALDSLVQMVEENGLTEFGAERLAESKGILAAVIAERERLRDLVPRAAHFAFCAHVGQKRKYTGRPYIEHPARVASRVSMLINCPASAVAAAWLHDVIEDCPGFVAKLRELFPADVVSLVEELTNPSHGMKARRAARKEMDRNHIARASKWALVIKCLDRIDNLAEIDAEQAGGFCELYRSESVLLADAIGSANTNDDWQVDKLVGELRAALTTTQGTQE